jgi:hypothetical protein
VTLREQAKFDADLLEIAARQEYWKADADIRAADTSLDAVDTSGDVLRLLAPPIEQLQLPAPVPAPAPAPD